MIKGIDLTVLFGPGVPVPAPRIVVDALQSVSGRGELRRDAERLRARVRARQGLAAQHAVPARRRRRAPDPAGRAERHDQRPGDLADQRRRHPDADRARQRRRPATLSVKGKDLTRGDGPTSTSPGIPYPAMPPVARVALILAKYAWLGVIPQVIPSLEGPPLPTEKIPRHQDTDLAYITHAGRARPATPSS